MQLAAQNLQQFDDFIVNFYKKTSYERILKTKSSSS